MRLLTRSTLLSAFVSLIVLVISGFYIFDQVSQEVKDEIEEKLQNRKLEILASIARQPNPIAGYEPIATDFQIDIIPLATYDTLQEHYEDVSLYELIEEENEPHRQLITKFTHRGAFYVLRIHTSLLDLEDMGEIIAYSTASVIIGLVGLSFLLNFFLQQRLWQPFYSTLAELRTFRIDQPEPLSLPPSAVQEFKELNQTISSLTAVNQRSYQLQKQFVENASHELQTPLAIALHQTELLIQNPDLRPTDAQALELLTQQLERLSAMNKALLLISKIDNQQFGETQPVDLGGIVRQAVVDYEFLADQKHLQVQLSLAAEVVVLANYHLLEMLVRNVIRNALIHSVSESIITIQLTNQSLRIENTAAPGIDQPETLFGRFVKQSDKPQSLGLGLAIVKSICDTYHFTPAITIQGNQFVFSVHF